MDSRSLRSRVEQLLRDVSGIQRDLERESRREADESRALAQAQSSLRSASPTFRQSREREVERHQNALLQTRQKRAIIDSRLASKNSELHKAQEQLSRAEQQEREREAQNRRGMDQQRDRYIARLQQDLKAARDFVRPEGDFRTIARADMPRGYDVFLCHATEDKEQIVRPLADALDAGGLRVWYDEFVLKVGDSLRRTIDRGLASSRFGVVIVSEAFFAKNWPQYELDGLVARENVGAKVILPIWHKVSKDQVLSYSPTLADRVALNTGVQSLSEIAAEIIDVASTPLSSEGDQL